MITNLEKIFLVLTPLTLILLAIFVMPDSWAAATLVLLLYFIFISVKGRVIAAHLALGIAAGLWVLFLPEIGFSFLSALAAMAIFSFIPGQREKSFKLKTDISDPNLNPHSTHGRDIAGV